MKDRKEMPHLKITIRGKESPRVSRPIKIIIRDSLEKRKTKKHLIRIISTKKAKPN
jgi:hypothetical protein